MNNARYTTASYTKLFLLMVIPIYGLCFTILLAFSKDIEDSESYEDLLSDEFSGIRPVIIAYTLNAFIIMHLSLLKFLI